LPLRLLLIEDSEDDAQLLVRELRKGGFDPDFARVETPQELEVALDGNAWDAVIADYSLPAFTGLDALRIIQAKGLDLPFILVSGVIGEEKAVEAMKTGAHDYLRKGNFPRLAPALERELRDAEVRRERRQAVEELRRAHGELEMRVRQRTAELAETNEVLRAEIAERERTEEELLKAKKAAEAASRAKSRFLANMSHELRTPMAGFLGMLEVTLGGPLDPQQREYIETACTSGRSLMRILNDILDLTRIEAGLLAMEDKPFALRECVDGATNIFIPEARRKGLDLTFAAEDDLPQTVVGDQVRLRQVLTNLIGNAVKFTERGKVEVRITTGERTAAGKREFTVSVIDTGIGIPADKKDLLFNSFSQVDDSDTRSYGGVGLGLAISRELVERMGGTIAFESLEGRGSTFSCTVPLGEAEETGGASCPSTAGAALRAEAERRPRLLVAEDDAVTRKVLGLMLQRSNFETDFATDGRQAVEMWEHGGYDLVLMDVQMPRIDGFAATRTIRDRERELGCHTPIVALTAHALKEDEQRCLDAGMDAHLSKPIDFRKCVEMIRDILGQDGRPA
jgi:signal transduction histidine kinase